MYIILIQWTNQHSTVGYVCRCRQSCRKLDKQITENFNPIIILLCENTMSGPELTTEEVDFTKNEAYDVLNIGVSQS